MTWECSTPARLFLVVCFAVWPGQLHAGGLIRNLAELVDAHLSLLMPHHQQARLEADLQQGRLMRAQAEQHKAPRNCMWHACLLTSCTSLYRFAHGDARTVHSWGYSERRKQPLLCASSQSSAWQGNLTSSADTGLSRVPAPPLSKGTVALSSGKATVTSQTLTRPSLWPVNSRSLEPGTAGGQPGGRPPSKTHRHRSELRAPTADGTLARLCAA